MRLISKHGYEIPIIANHQSNSATACILAHGITAEKSEGGIFNRQAQRLNDRGISTVQFDFIGHGESSVRSQEMTIERETSDLEDVIDSLANFEQVFLIAASFGAVATGFLSSRHLSRLEKLCLWNPVISIERTFRKPELPWQVANFGEDRLQLALARNENLKIDGAFEVGQGLITELLRVEVASHFDKIEQPTLIIHGDRDTYVSYEVAREKSSQMKHCEFQTVVGSEHGFGRPEEEAIVLSRTTSFLLGAV